MAKPARRITFGGDLDDGTRERQTMFPLDEPQPEAEYDELQESDDVKFRPNVNCVALAIDKLWQEMRQNQLTSRSGKTEVLEVFEVIQDKKNKTVASTAERRIKGKMVRMLSGEEDADADPSNNFLLKLISKDAKHKYHIKLAFQFLRAMVKTGDWTDYIVRTLGISRERIKDADDSEDRGNGLLHEAAKTGCCVILEPYLREEHVHMRNAKGETPLHLAAEFGRAEDVDILLKKGAVMEVDHEGSTPLHSAAISMNPSARVVQLLIASDLTRALRSRLINAVINQTLETALHCAAANRNVTEDFIAALEIIDPLMRNAKGETAFHVAARSSNESALSGILTTFAPTKFGWDIDDVDGDRDLPWSATSNSLNKSAELQLAVIEYEGDDDDDDDDEKRTELLIDICSRNGNADAVAVLIQNGADLNKGVLHTIIDESVKNPSKIDSLKAVYQAVVENTVLWNHLERNAKCPPKGSPEYAERLRDLMIGLTTRPPGGRTKLSSGALEYAIESGAMDILMEMINTEEVYKFDDCENASNPKTSVLACVGKIKRAKSAFVKYDVTDFVSATEVEPTDVMSKPRQPYLNCIIEHYDIWLDKNILKEQPFLKLTEPLITFVQWLFFFVGLLQLGFMIWFSVGQMDVKDGKNDTSTAAATPGYRQRSQSEMGGLVVWPAVIFVASVVHLTLLCAGLIRRQVLYYRNQTSVKPRDDIVTSLALVFTDKFTVVAFSISVFAWHATRNDADPYYHDMAKAMAMLFGWMTAFIFFSGYTKEFYVFSILLREIIIKDILMRFALFYIFTVVAFSFAIHVLRHMSQVGFEPPRRISLDVTVFQVFIVSIGLGDEILNDASDAQYGDHTLFKLVFAVYMCLSAIILLNVLIAMMNQRYDDAMSRAESEWRFQVVSTALHLQNRRLVGWFPCLDVFNWDRCCCSNRRVVYELNVTAENDVKGKSSKSAPVGRYYVYVRRKGDVDVPNA